MITKNDYFYNYTYPKAVTERPFYTFWRFNRPYFRRYAIGAGLAFVFVIINLVFPMVVRAIVFGFADGNLNWNRLLLYFALILFTATGAGIARYFQRTLMIGASRKFEYDLRNAYFHRILTLSARFFHHMPTGDIMTRATSDINHVRNFIGPGVMGTVDMMIIPFTLAMMVYLSPALTAYALLPLPALTILVYFFIRFMNHQSQIVQEIFSTISDRAQENLTGARVVRAYAIEDRELLAFEKVSQKYKKANILLATVMSFTWPLIDFLIGVAILVVIYQGGRMVISGTLALGDFTAFMVVVAMLSWPLVQFGWVLTLYQRGAVSMNRISEVLNTPVEIEDDEGTISDAQLEQGAIRFEDVCFRYNTDDKETDWTLENISFDVNAGETLAIVGPTGSGKSTIISLLCRLYDPVQGAIRIDNIKLQEYPIKALRAAMGCAPQDSFVFSDTIRENIRMANPDMEDGAVKRACDIACFTKDLEEMADGLDTLLGERGINLSGGQKQRLMLARAIARDPVILLLDDTLSSVDADTEQAILHGLRNVMASRTSIIISHRVSAIAHADHIIVLEAGRIVERGRHDELITGDGLYKRMYYRQMLEEKLDTDE